MSTGVARVGEYVQALAKLVVNGGLPVDEVQKELHRNVVVEAMHKHFGNQCRAARAMGVHRNTFTRWMKLFDVAPSTGRRLKKQESGECH